MQTGCPGQCTSVMQRPIGVADFSRLSNRARANILLLEESAWLCEACGTVYVTSEHQSVVIVRINEMKN